MLRRALRHAFTILSALSLLLCVVVGVLWVRSYTARDVVSIPLSSKARETENVATPFGYDEQFETKVHDAVLLGSFEGSLRVQRRRFVRDGGNMEFRLWSTDAAIATPMEARARTAGFDHEWTFAGFSGLRNGSALTGFWQVGIPFWSIAVGALVLPALCAAGWARRRRAERLRLAGGCLSCGYDLRAHKGGERCPECGTPVQGAA